MIAVLASGNLHKAEEISAMLPGFLELKLQSDFDITPAEETAGTFIENALIKARHAAALTGLPALADDSGICVEALAGNPGVRSARYAGPGASDQDNLAKLLDDMRSIDNRAASFYCVLVYLAAADDPAPLVAEGRWHGELSRQPAGQHGFGYDPIFYLPDAGCTAAELEPAQKNLVSHRGLALGRLAALISERYRR